MNRLVLIADSNASRSARLVESCREAGLDTCLANTGAAALEQALTSCPALVVATPELPLIDAPRLAEILRANPRTGSARFVFLGSERGAAVGDLSLPAADRPEVALPAIQELLAKQDRAEQVDAEAEGSGEARGELAQLPLAELLQLFHLSRRSGRLFLDCEASDNAAEPGAARRGEIAIRDGEVVQATTSEVSGAKALFRLLAWSQGHFRFEASRPDDPPQILTPTRALLGEGLRQIEEGARLAGQLPALDALVRLQVKSNELPNIVHPLTQEVLLLLELYGKVSEVVDHCSFPDYQVLRTLHTLAQRGIIEIHRSAQSTNWHIGPAPETKGLFDEAQTRRLRTWLRDGRTPRRAPLEGKLLIASSDPAALPDLANLLREVPGVALAEDLPAGADGAVGLGPLGRIDLDGQCGIDLVNVPVDEAYAPLWPLAGHAALGTLFLLSGPVGEASRRIRAMSEALREQPRARVFHVVLLAKGERITPEELRENLSLFDEASLFLLPIESGKSPAALLRSLFARVVP